MRLFTSVSSSSSCSHLLFRLESLSHFLCDCLCHCIQLFVSAAMSWLLYVNGAVCAQLFSPMIPSCGCQLLSLAEAQMGSSVAWNKLLKRTVQSTRGSLKPTQKDVVGGQGTARGTLTMNNSKSVHRPRPAKSPNMPQGKFRVGEFIGVEGCLRALLGQDVSRTSKSVFHTETDLDLLRSDVNLRKALWV